MAPEVRLLQGDAAAVLRRLPEASVHRVVTSPPYYGLRSYLPKGHPDKPEEIGLEETPAAYVARLQGTFREVWRVLTPDGVLFVNLGDSYSHGGRGKRDPDLWPKQSRNDHMPPRGKRRTGLAAKNLLGIPWRVAFALQDDGWILRAEIILAKRNPMPDSVADRVTRSHEQLFHFTKRRQAFWDREAIVERAVSTRPSGNGYHRPERISRNGAGQEHPWVPASATFRREGSKRAAVIPGRTVGTHRPDRADTRPEDIRNARSVWEITPRPDRSNHFAVMSSEVVARCLLAGTSAHGHCPRCGAGWRRIVERSAPIKGPNGPGTAKKIREYQGPHGETSVLDTSFYHARETVGWQPGCKHGDLPAVPAVVLDPFAGSGTTLLVALGHGRHALGIDLSREYVEMTRRRLGLFAPTAEETRHDRLEEPLGWLGRVPSEPDSQGQVKPVRGENERG